MSVNGLSAGHTLSNGHTEEDVGGSSPLDITKAGSIAEIRATLAHLSKQEATVTERLNNLVASQRDLSRELGRLDILRAHLGSQATNTRAISNDMLSNAATTANRISSAVKRLDLEQSRVKATLEVVEQVAELKACVLGVTGSMGAPQDWETAAGYLSRALKIPKEIVNGTFAEEVVPTAEVPDPPSVTLENTAESLCGLFLREFEKAAKENDGAKVTRFFKLFPLIGRSNVGLEIYGRHVCEGVASRARANLNAGTGGAQRKEGFFYANALTKLFEHIAQIVDGHGALVERHYGVGRMVKVIERLQIEADVQGGIILDTWVDERNVDRRLRDIRSYAFSFLVQSFLPVQKGASGTPRANSPMSRDNITDRRVSEDEGVDMKEVDSMLSEIAVMLGRWSLYCRFLATKCMPPLPEDAPEESLPPLELPELLSTSTLNKKVSDRLIGPFNAMTTFFVRRSVEKAFQLDEQPSDLSLNISKSLESNPPFITSAVDDVMYIVNNVIQRSLATSQRVVVAGVVPAIGRVLGADFVGMIQRKMRDESYPKGAVQGALPPEEKIVAFLVLLNNLDVATDYIKRIVATHNGTQNAQGAGRAAPLDETFPFGTDAAFAASALNSMQTSFEGKTGELIMDGIHVAFNQIIKPRLRPLLADAFRDADYTLSEEDLARIRDEDTINGMEGGEDDPAGIDGQVRARFELGWDALMKPLRRILTDRNADRLLTTTTSYLSRMLEKRLWGFSGRVNELGGVRLERDVSGIVGVAVKGGRYGLRDAFIRCVQMCMIMNLEEDEWEEIEDIDEKDTSSMIWKLGKDERVRARAMVTRSAR